MRSVTFKMSAASSLQPYIFSGQFADLVSTCNSWKYPVGIAGLHFFQREVGGDDSWMPVQPPLADTGEELGGNEGIGEFRPQVIDDQQITSIEIVGEFSQRVSAATAESAVGQPVT